jgi:integrase
MERDDGADPLLQVHPEHLVDQPVELPPAHLPPISLRGLLNDHLTALEREGRGRAGRKSWPRVFENLIKFLVVHRSLTGRGAIQMADDATQLTPKELTACRDDKLATLSAKTVKDVWMASVKAVLQRAVEDHKLEENPASKVKVRASSRTVSRPKGYTDAEALTILRAALGYQPKVNQSPRTTESAHITAAKRWGPWLCAFTGARVAQIVQVRRSDVLAEGEVHFLRITPDAGSVKSGIFRDVPLHPQLIDLGFLDSPKKGA